MRVYNWKDNINENELNILSSKIASGELVVFPTETVYGIGTNALKGDNCKNIYKAKGRPSDNPLIVHVSDKEMLEKYVKNISDVEEKLIDKFMPGPFTLILEKSKEIPDAVTAGLDTVAIRMPDNKIAKTLIEKSGVPIAAPSANVSGKPSGTNIEDIKEELGDKVYGLIDGGSTKIGLESTVVKVVGGVPKILRPGKVTAEEIKDLVGIVEVDSHVLGKVDKEEKVESPGMKHKHYAPTTKCILVDIQDEKEKTRKLSEVLNKNIALIGFSKTAKLLENETDFDMENFFDFGETEKEISKNIFSILRKADKKNFDLILIEGVEPKGLGLAIMNRLLRTCDYNVLK